jgi:uncharacterized protein (UPF0333 family)
MKHISRERGAVSVLAVVLVLVVVAAVGFAVYNATRARNSDTPSVSTSPSPTDSPATNASPTASPSSDQDLIAAAVRAYNSQSTNDTVSGITIVGANAKGNGATPGAPSGYLFVAHKDSGTWKVVYRGQEKPGKALGEQYGLPADWYSTAY